MPINRSTEAENELSQKNNTNGEARRSTGSECIELIRNVMILHPDLPAANLVEPFIALADAELLIALDEILRAAYVIQTVKKLRARDRRQEAADGWLFPEVRKLAASLPPAVPVGKDETVERAKVVYEDLENYLKVLNKKNRERHKKRIAAVKALMALWPRRTSKTRGTTLADVDELRARRAGLI